MGFNMKENYFDSIVMIERLHRLFLEVIKVDLDRQGIRDINNVQALVLYNIGKGQLTVGELTQRGYYLGSNVSYNLRKMVQNSYIVQEPSPHDKRSSHVKLSNKGIMLFEKLDDLLGLQSEALSHEGMDDKKCRDLRNALQKLDTFWSALINKDLRKQ